MSTSVNLLQFPHRLFGPRQTMKFTRVVMWNCTVKQRVIHNRLFVGSRITMLFHQITGKKQNETYLEKAIFISVRFIIVQYKILPSIHSLQTLNYRRFISEQGDLAILNLTLADDGVYECLAENPSGIIRTYARLAVLGKDL